MIKIEIWVQIQSDKGHFCDEFTRCPFYMQIFKKGKAKYMFISKKTLNQKIEEAVHEAEEKRYIHSRIDYAMEDANRKFKDLEKRVAALEDKQMAETATLIEAEVTEPLNGFTISG